MNAKYPGIKNQDDYVNVNIPIYSIAYQISKNHAITELVSEKLLISWEEFSKDEKKQILILALANVLEKFSIRSIKDVMELRK